MHMRFATVFITDDDKAIDFYTNRLGFRLLADNPTPMGTRFLMFDPPGGGAKLVLTRPFRDEDRSRVGGFTGLSWETDDLQALYEALTAKEVTFTTPPRQTPWGGLEASFTDPDGNAYMLHQGHLVR